MTGKGYIETTAAQVTAELLRLGFGADERVWIIIEPVEGIATTRQKSHVCVVIAGRDDDGSGRAIEQPNLAEKIRRRFAPFGGVDLELPPREVAEEPPSFDP
jgi:hypothetical protein